MGLWIAAGSESATWRGTGHRRRSGTRKAAKTTHLARAVRPLAANRRIKPSAESRRGDTNSSSKKTPTFGTSSSLPAMIATRGVYEHGAIVLEGPVALPEGAHVPVTLEPDGEHAGPVDICCDGTPWDDSPEGRRKWLEWFDSTEPVFTEEEYEQFVLTLRAMREEQKPVVEPLARKIDALFE